MRRAKRRRRRGGQTGDTFRPTWPPRRFAPPLLCEKGNTSMIPDDHLDFLQAVWERRSTYTYVFFALNILVFLLMTLLVGRTNETTLIALSVKSNAAITHET